MNTSVDDTSSGVVRARYEYIGQRLIISIDDTGEGIPKEIMARIHANNEQISHNTSGLGLAICKELVKQMGGTIDIVSEVGEGTTVYITIPCQATGMKRKRMES